jgi:hypothetical protein
LRESNQRIDTLDRLLDKCRVGTGEFEGAEALGGVKIFKHVQEELVEQSDLLWLWRWGDEEGHGFIILGSDAVCCVEVEQVVCTKGIMTMELERDVE